MRRKYQKNKPRQFVGPGLCLGMLLGLASPAHASLLSDFSSTDLGLLTDDMVNSLVQTAAIGAAYRPMMPATPLGAIIGLELSVDVSAVSLPDDFKTAIATAAGVPESSVPAFFPLPKLSAHKGFPHGFDVGFGGMAYQNIFKLYGGDLKWAIPNPNIGNSRFSSALPTVALRASASYSQLYYLSTRSYDVAVMASKNFKITDPYAGVGYLFWNGDVNAPGLLSVIDGHRSGSNPHVFVGIPLRLMAFRVTGEYDYDFAKVTTIGARIGIGF